MDSYFKEHTCVNILLRIKVWDYTEYSTIFGVNFGSLSDIAVKD